VIARSAVTNCRTALRSPVTASQPSAFVLRTELEELQCETSRYTLSISCGSGALRPHKPRSPASIDNDDPGRRGHVRRKTASVGGPSSFTAEALESWKACRILAGCQPRGVQSKEFASSSPVRSIRTPRFVRPMSHMPARSGRLEKRIPAGCPSQISSLQIRPLQSGGRPKMCALWEMRVLRTRQAAE